MNTEIVTISNTASGVEDLIEASKCLLNATEQQFESMRKEKWFNRVFDMITFSQKKNIRLGEQIQTLAQAQNIYLQILPRVAEQNNEIAAVVEKAQSDIEALSQNDLSLLQLYQTFYRRLENERLGIKKGEDIAMLSEADKLMLSTCLRTLSKIFDMPSDLQKRYFNVIHQYIGYESEGNISWEELRKRSNEAKIQSLQCCLEYIFLFQERFVFSEVLQAFLDNFDLGSRTIHERVSFVTEMFHARGVEGVIGKYTGDQVVDEISAEFPIELQFPAGIETGEGAIWEKNDTETEKNEDIKVDPYRQVKAVILSKYASAFPEEQGDKRQKTQERRMKDFRNKYLPSIANEALVAFAEVLLSYKVLFTTHGLYILESFKKDVNFFDYSEIDLEKFSISFAKKGNKIETITIASKNKEKRISLTVTGINCDELQDLCFSIANCPTATRDIPVPVNQLPVDNKIIFCKILIHFSRKCNLNPSEAIRVATDLGLVSDDLSELICYTYIQSNTVELDQLLADFNVNIPYPSIESFQYALIQSLFSVVQFSSGRCRELYSIEYDYITTVASRFGIVSSVLAEIIKAAQVPYRILRKDIDEKEIHSIGQSLSTVAAGIGLPVVTVLGSSFLWANTLWFMFIPGIGTIITAGAVGIAVATAVFKKSNKNSMEPLYEEQHKQIETSYLKLHQEIEAITDNKVRDNLRAGLLNSVQKIDKSMIERLSL